jgi:hypothetical protein
MKSGKGGSHLGNLPLALRGIAKMAKESPALADNDPNAVESKYSFADSFSTQPGVSGILLNGLMLTTT